MHEQEKWSAGITLEPFERLAQLVVLPIAQVQFTVVDEFEQSTRGTGGFGSTGKS